MKYITSGELATLAGTTKRSIRLYTDLGIIKPQRVNEKGYHLYSPKQVLEYQRILLLRTSGLTLNEIRSSINKGKNLNKIFKTQSRQINESIKNMQFHLNNLRRYQRNLEQTNTLVNPRIKIMKPFNIYFIDIICDYVEIGKNCDRLRDMFKQTGPDFTTLAIFYNTYYKPKLSKIRLGAIAKRGMIIKDEYKRIVQKTNFRPGKVITYTHNGSGTILSLFWKELEKYCHLNNLSIRKNIPDFEIYTKVHKLDRLQHFDIFLPID